MVYDIPKILSNFELFMSIIYIIKILCFGSQL